MIRCVVALFTSGASRAALHVDRWAVWPITACVYFQLAVITCCLPQVRRVHGVLFSVFRHWCWWYDRKHTAELFMLLLFWYLGVLDHYRWCCKSVIRTELCRLFLRWIFASFTVNSVSPGFEILVRLFEFQCVRLSLGRLMKVFSTIPWTLSGGESLFFSNDELFGCLGHKCHKNVDKCSLKSKLQPSDVSFCVRLMLNTPTLIKCYTIEGKWRLTGSRL